MDSDLEETIDMSNDHIHHANPAQMLDSEGVVYNNLKNG